MLCQIAMGGDAGSGSCSLYALGGNLLSSWDSGFSSVKRECYITLAQFQKFAVRLEKHPAPCLLHGRGSINVCSLLLLC